jgi:hypothetical protein
MESRSFIKAAAVLIEKIKAVGGPATTQEEDHAMAQANQKELNNLFSGLSNPTLPSAYRLRDVALDYGYQIDPRVLQNIARLEHITG